MEPAMHQLGGGSLLENLLGEQGTPEAQHIPGGAEEVTQ